LSLFLIFTSHYAIDFYDISIYSELPISMWILLILSLLIGLISTSYNLMSYTGLNIYYKLGFFLVVNVCLAVILLPTLLGYQYVSHGDHLTHLGYAKYIFNNGHIYDVDLYPLIHILLYEVSSITNTSLDMDLNLIGPIFYLFFILFTFFLSSLLLDKTIVAFSLVISAIPICFFYGSIYPMGNSILLSPLIFGLYFKSLLKPNPCVKFILIILLISLLYYHPASCILFFIFIVIIEIIKLIAYYVSCSSSLFINKKYPIYFFLPILMFIVIISWIWTNLRIWQSTILSVASWFYLEIAKKDIIFITSESVNRVGLSSSDFMFLVFKMYGTIFIFLILSFLCIVLIIGKKVITKHNFFILIYSLLFLISVAFWVCDLVNPLTLVFNSGRFIWVVVTFFPLLVGISIYAFSSLNSIFNTNNGTGLRLVKLMMWIIISVCIVSTFFSLYPSSYTYRSNSAVELMQIDGFNFLLTKGNSNFKTIGAGVIDPYRYADALFDISFSEYPRWDDRAPAHFNYENNSSLGQSYFENKYLLVRKIYLLNMYNALYPNSNLYSAKDFHKLDYDTSVFKLYDNSDLELFFVRGLNSGNTK